jgi:hypothetical protein
MKYQIMKQTLFFGSIYDQSVIFSASLLTDQ